MGFGFATCSRDFLRAFHMAYAIAAMIRRLIGIYTRLSDLFISSITVELVNVGVKFTRIGGICAINTFIARVDVVEGV
jgi:hypothetical protein